jgi:hypothetical protein
VALPRGRREACPSPAGAFTEPIRGEGSLERLGETGADPRGNVYAAPAGSKPPGAGSRRRAGPRAMRREKHEAPPQGAVGGANDPAGRKIFPPGAARSGRPASSLERTRQARALTLAANGPAGRRAA